MKTRLDYAFEGQDQYETKKEMMADNCPGHMICNHEMPSVQVRCRTQGDIKNKLQCLLCWTSPVETTPQSTEQMIARYMDLKHTYKVESDKDSVNQYLCGQLKALITEYEMILGIGE